MPDGADVQFGAVAADLNGEVVEQDGQVLPHDDHALNHHFCKRVREGLKDGFQEGDDTKSEFCLRTMEVGAVGRW